ncbi:hypothetical protein J4Q44_G00364570 [Coregonus suidteri]|uniref:Uncharacterized protein n=1 Tax=Coregonus suidteri TaxID=861788 RepID=A0AAN8QAW6_9TELE
MDTDVKSLARYKQGGDQTPAWLVALWKAVPGPTLTGRFHYVWICWCRVRAKEREQDRAKMGISFSLWIAPGGQDHQDFQGGQGFRPPLAQKNL